MSCVVDFAQPPAYCQNPKANNNTKCALWNAGMTQLGDVLTRTPNAQGVMYADLASCQTVPASSVVQSGVTISQVKLSNNAWPGQDVVVSTNLCAQSRYPVFDQTTGKVAMVASQPVQHQSNLWSQMSQDCKANLPKTYVSSTTSLSKRKASHMDFSQDWAHDDYDDYDDYPAAKKHQADKAHSANTTSNDPASANPQNDFAGAFNNMVQDNKQQASFTYSCASPSQTCYTMCRLPGWDYVDKSTTPWSFTNKPPNKACGKAPVSGTTCKGDSNATSGGEQGIANACQASGCCVPTFSGSNTCALCAGNIESNLETAKIGFWNDTASPDLNAPTGSMTLALPYTGPNGVAITPATSYTGDISSFGDPVDCYPGGPFNGFCTGLQGCTGTNASDCVQGLSNFQLGAGPAYNCPNIYTLSRQANSCQAPGTTYNSTTAPYSLSGGPTQSYSTVTHMFVPEGAYVTGWNLGPTIGFDGGEGLCAPNEQLPKLGIQLMCGREAVSSSSPRSSSSSSSCSGAGYQLTGLSNTFSVDQSGNYHHEAPPVDSAGAPISYNGNVATLNGVCGCYFKNLTNVAGTQTYSVVNRGYQGFTFGFMPGYYNSNLQTGQGFCS